MTDDHAIPRLRARLAATAALVLFSIVLLGAGVATNEAETDRGDELKPVMATLIVKFCTFITWPEGAFEDGKSKLVIGIVGDEKLGSLTIGAAKKRKRTEGDREIEVRRFESLVREDGSLNPIEPIVAKLLECHVIFVSRTQERALPQIMKLCDRRPCLTVSDMSRFAEKGGMIEVFRHGERLWFDINRSTYERCRLRVTDEFLLAARTVLPVKK